MDTYGYFSLQSWDKSIAAQRYTKIQMLAREIYNRITLNACFDNM